MKLNWLLRLPWRRGSSRTDLLWQFNTGAPPPYAPISLVKRAIPSSAPLKVTEILPRLKEGGAFVKFQHANEITAKEIETLVKGYLKENPITPWFNPFRRIHANLVVGKPWLEDLYRFPSNRIKVEFIPTSPGGEAAEISQENLYSLFRRYGKLADISSQPSDSKILPKYAELDFARLEEAVIARNCMHGFKIVEAAGGGKAGTELRLSFESKHKSHFFRDWIVNHP